MSIAVFLHVFVRSFWVLHKVGVKAHARCSPRAWRLSSSTAAHQRGWDWAFATASHSAMGTLAQMRPWFPWCRRPRGEKDASFRSLNCITNRPVPVPAWSGVQSTVIDLVA